MRAFTRNMPACQILDFAASAGKRLSTSAAAPWAWHSRTQSRCTAPRNFVLGCERRRASRSMGVFRPWVQASEEDELEYRDMYLEAPLHRGVGKDDLQRSCRVGGRRVTAEEIEAMVLANPDMGVSAPRPLAANHAERVQGYRVQERFARELEASAALGEVRAACEMFGHGLDRWGKPKAKEEGDCTLVAWGREEVPGVPVAPWGSGHTFDQSKIPPAIATLAARIQDCGHFAIGPMVDLAVRSETGLGSTEPGSQPGVSGEVVALVNLGGDSVVTLTPSFEDRRTDPVLSAVLSWTDYDVDVLLRSRSVLVLSGSSLREWRCGVRSGLAAEFKGGAPGVCDWWGSTEHLLRRGEARVTIAVGFMSPDFNARW